MIHHLLTPLEAASLSQESKQWFDEAMMVAFEQGAAARDPKPMMLEEERRIRAAAIEMLHDGHLGIPATKWFGKAIPKSVDFDTCE